MEENKYHTLILSGGGTKGLCILGALQYMQDTKRLECDSIKRFIGTSIGAIISYFLAIGYTPMELVVWLCSHNVLESLSMNNFDGILKGDGVYNYSTLHKEYEVMTREKMDFIPTLRGVKERFGKELVMCTYNFTKKKKEYLGWRTHPDLSCLDAMRMSSNLPFIFSPFWYEGDEYIDGGIVENFSFTSIPKLIEIEKEMEKEMEKEIEKERKEKKEIDIQEDKKDKENDKKESDDIQDIEDIQDIQDIDDIVNVTISVIQVKDDKEKEKEEKEEKNKYKKICGICLNNEIPEYKPEENEKKEKEKDKEKDKEKEKEKKYNKITAVLDKVYDLMMVPISEYENVMIDKYRDVIELITIHAKGIKIYTFQLPSSEKLELFSVGYNQAKQHFLL